MTEIIKNAVEGVNIIPTALLGFVLIYWLVLMVGAIDLDFFEIDLDLDADGSGAFYAILVFLNINKLPFMLVISIITLNFWIISMLIYYLPIDIGGLLNGLLLIPAFLISLLITKVVTSPLKGLFDSNKVQDDRFNEIKGQLCTLMCDVKEGRLGQGKIERDGAELLINVKSEYDEDTFEKGEEVYVSKKDNNKNIYYILKVKE